MTGSDFRPFLIRALTVARTEIAALTALFVAALGVMTFIEIADDMTEADGQAFDQQVLALGLIGGVMLSEGLKAVFERERPPQALQAVETINASFPSGHALLATVFYLSVAVMLTRAFPRQRFKIFVLGVGILMALLVGLTRIYLGAHWATDVFAGWAVGSAWAMVLWLVAYGVARWQKRHQAPLQDEPSPIEPETMDVPTKV